MTTPRAVAVIPARAGSSRVANKNFRTFDGTNLTEMALRVAADANVFQHIILSTDAPSGPSIAAANGVMLHVRSAHAASSAATATDVLDDLRETFAKVGVRPNDYVFYLQPTSPYRTVGMLRSAWEHLRCGDRPGLASVVAVDPKYAKVLWIRGGDLAFEQAESTLSSNQQGLEPLYLPNGNVFAFRLDELWSRGVFPVVGLSAIVQSPEESLDIDTEEDFDTFLRCRSSRRGLTTGLSSRLSLRLRPKRAS